VPPSLAAVQHRSAESDPGGVEVLDPDGDGDDVHAVGVRRHDDRRATRAAAGHRRGLAGQAEVSQLGGKGADGAPVQAGASGQFGSGSGSGYVQKPEQPAQVVPAHLLLDRRG